MDRVIHGHEVQSGARFSGISMPAEQKHGDMMVPVQKEKISLAEYNKHGINQLRQLGKNEQHSPKSTGTLTIRSTGNIADAL
jgi:hypothetical protein